MDLDKLSKIKNKNIRKMAAQISFTWEVIKRMEKYHKEHYENRQEHGH